MIISFVLLFFLLSNSLDSILNFDIESNDYVETTVDIDLDNDVLDLRQVLNVNAYKILKVTVFVFSFTLEIYLVNNFPIKAIIPPPDIKINI